MGSDIVIWPKHIMHKDINDMILADHSIEEVKNIIKENTFSGLIASTKLSEWRKI